jgi:hypothetical protein
LEKEKARRMKFKILVEYEYPVEHKPPVKAELILHGDRVVTDNIKWIEQEPKTGHWIATGDYYTGAYDSIDYVECSCCHYESLEEGDFCPNCGARMIEPQESEG